MDRRTPQTRVMLPDSLPAPADAMMPAFGSVLNHPALPVLYDDADLRISCLPGSGDHCVITFIGVGLGFGGIEQQSEEFRSLGPTWGPQLFVFDKNRTWGNAIDFDRIEVITRPYRTGRTVVCLGLSMGGFLAIKASEQLGAKCCIALAPQYSVHPEIAPFENRWPHYTGLISRWTIPSLEGAFGPECRYYVFFPDCAQDRLHQALFPKLGNLVCAFLDGSDHNVAATLKKQGLLYSTLEACILGTWAPGTQTDGG